MLEYWNFGLIIYHRGDLGSPPLFQYSNIFLSSYLFGIPPDSDGDIWTYFPADRTPCALSIRIPDYVKIPLAIDFFPNLHQGFWAGDRTEPTSLTTLLVNFNFGHHSHRKAME